ncbi:MAG TPA: hypothetical protein VK866_11070, partial [Acidimicrobiales bacterium]|nr:hypothetical protein [Acidimicrobiales bacterium]
MSAERFLAAHDADVATWWAAAVDDPGGGVAGVVEGRLGDALSVVVDLAAPDRLAEIRVESPDLDAATAPDEAVLAALAALLGASAAELAREGRAGSVDVGPDELGRHEPLARLVVALHDDVTRAEWGTRLIEALVAQLDPRVRALLGRGSTELAVPAGAAAANDLLGAPRWVERWTGPVPRPTTAPLPALVESAAAAVARPAGVPVLSAPAAVELADGSAHLLHGGVVPLDGLVAPAETVDVTRDARIVWDRTTGELELRIPLGSTVGDDLWARVSDAVDGAPLWIAPLRASGGEGTASGLLPGAVVLDDVVLTIGPDPLVPPPPAPARTAARAAALGRLAGRADELGAERAARDAWRRAG